MAIQEDGIECLAETSPFSFVREATINTTSLLTGLAAIAPKLEPFQPLQAADEVEKREFDGS